MDFLFLMNSSTKTLDLATLFCKQHIWNIFIICSFLRMCRHAFHIFIFVMKIWLSFHGTFIFGYILICLNCFAFFRKQIILKTTFMLLGFLEYKLNYCCLRSNVEYFRITGQIKYWGRCGRYRMIVGFITTYAISAYHHYCEFESHWGKMHSIQHCVIKFVSDLRQVVSWYPGFLHQ